MQDPKPNPTAEAHRVNASEKELVGALLALGDIAEAHGDPQVAVAARDGADRLLKHKFHLAVFGEFKRGKSTLINALLGMDLLPTGVVPLTSVVTRIGYGEPPSAEVEFKDGHRRSIPTSSIGDFATEHRNPDNEKGVAIVDVAVPSPFLRNGVCLIDTPGMGSVYAHNTAAARAFLERADAAVFVLTADAPLSAQESELLRDLAARFPLVLPVLNKTDNFDAAELQEALSFTEENVSRIEGMGRRVFPVSAKCGLAAKLSGDADLLRQSGTPILEAELLGLLGSDRDRISLQSADKTLRHWVAALRDRLAVERVALTKPLDELEAGLRRFAVGLAELKRRREEELFLLRERQRKNLLDELGRDLDTFRSACFPRSKELVLSRLEPTFAKGSGQALLRMAGSVMADVVEADFLGFQEGEVSRLRERVGGLGEALSCQSQAWLADIGTLSREVFDCPIPHRVDPPLLDDVRGFWVKRWYALIDVGMFLGAVYASTPARWSRRRLTRLVAAKLWQLYDMNCGNMRYEFQRRLERALDTYTSAVQGWLDEAAGTIEATMARVAETHRQGGEASEPALREIDRHNAALAKLENAGASGGS